MVRVTNRNPYIYLYCARDRGSPHVRSLLPFLIVPDVTSRKSLSLHVLQTCSFRVTPLLFWYSVPWFRVFTSLQSSSTHYDVSLQVRKPVHLLEPGVNFSFLKYVSRHCGNFREFSLVRTGLYVKSFRCNRYTPLP